MKTFEQIKDEGNICNYAKVEIKRIKMLAGEIYDRNQKIYFTLGDNEDGWEHVAIHVGNGKKTPSW